jgi:hypothetical protein
MPFSQPQPPWPAGPSYRRGRCPLGPFWRSASLFRHSLKRTACPGGVVRGVVSRVGLRRGMSFVGECLLSIDKSLDTESTDVVDAARAEEAIIISRIANGGRRHVFNEISDEMLSRQKRRRCTITGDVATTIDIGVCAQSRTPTCSPNMSDRKAVSFATSRPPLAPRLFTAPSQQVRRSGGITPRSRQQNFSWQKLL